MPPLIALLLCICFIGFLLRLDSLQYPEATRGLWIPSIWMLVVSTKALGTWFGIPGTTLEEGSPLDRNFLLFLMLIAIWMLAKRKFDLKSALQENKWLIILFVFMFISIAWSTYPFVSFKRWTREIIAIIMGFLVMTENHPFKAIECVIRRTVYILVPLSILLIKYFPHYGIYYTPWTGTRMWIGVADQKNDLAQLTFLAVFFLIWSMHKRWQQPMARELRHLFIADLTVLAIALHLSQGGPAGYSATSIVMLSVGLICYFGLLWLKKKRAILSSANVMAFIAALIIYGTVTPFLSRVPFGDISSSLGRNSTLTERTANWAALVPMAMTKPLLGHGVGGFWTTESINRFFFPAHNGYLEVILILGFAGLLLISIFLISSARKAHDQLSQGYDWGVLWICWLIMALLNNIAESSLNSFSNFLIAVPVWMTVAYKKHKP